MRRYLLAGLLACGRCGRRLESAWSNGKPAYLCRHGHPSAARPDPGRPVNAYVREDQVLPHLAALAILLTRQTGAAGRGRRNLAPLTGPAETADLIDRLRARLELATERLTACRGGTPGVSALCSRVTATSPGLMLRSTLRAPDWQPSASGR